MNKISLFIALAIVGVLPVAANAAVNPTLSPASVSGWGIDDQNTSTLVPNTVDANGNNTPTIYTAACQWITTAMNGLANTTYSWAAPFANLASDLTVTDYKPWVVNSINTVNGFNLVAGPTGKDCGGATFGLTYTPKNGDPTSVIFIQAYQETLNGLNGGGTTINVALDNGGNATPQYGGASSYTATVSKMADSPFDSETDSAKYPEGYNTDVEFQTVVAVYNGVVAGKADYTLYNYAEWWGYQYTNTDVPEPATIIIWSLLGGVGVAIGRRQRRKAA